MTDTQKLLLLLVGMIATVALLPYLAITRYAPQHYNPFMPLLIQDPTTFVTKFKLQKLKGNPQMCLDVLANSDLKYEKMLDKKTQDGCGMSNAVVLSQSGVSYGGNVILTCPALVSLAMWETHHLQQLAQEMFDQSVQRVRHYGTYNCRNINSAKKGRRSQHATANAIDIAGFRLKDGTEISVLKHWHSDSDKGEFLRELHSAACDYFKTVLGPDYNALHKDHFHFDMGSSSYCR